MPSEFARHWTLDQAVAFLNHGPYGAAPRPVLAAQQAWRDRMEAEPVRFFRTTSSPRWTPRGGRSEHSREPIPTTCPEAMVGCMASVPLPLETGPARVQGIELYDDEVHDHLARVGMQVMVTPWPQRSDGGPWRRLVRISATAYNDLEQYRQLAAALPGAVGAAVA